MKDRTTKLLTWIDGRILNQTFVEPEDWENFEEIRRRIILADRIEPIIRTPEEGIITASVMFTKGELIDARFGPAFIIDQKLSELKSKILKELMKEKK